MEYIYEENARPKVRHFNRNSTRFTSSTLSVSDSVVWWRYVSQYTQTHSCTPKSGRISFFSQISRFLQAIYSIHTAIRKHLYSLSEFFASTQNFHKNYTKSFVGNWEFFAECYVCRFVSIFVFLHHIYKTYNTHFILTSSIAVAFHFS